MSLLAIFSQELARIGGKPHPAESLEQAAAIYADICQEAASPALRVRWSTSLLETLDKEAVEITSRDRDEVIRLCAQAQIGLTEADFGIAETGSLVLESGPGRSRLASLLPPVHVAVLPLGRMVPSLQAFTERYAREENARHLQSMACLTFISGPSRTADIEMTLSIGVHGPQALHVILLKDA